MGLKFNAIPLGIGIWLAIMAIIAANGTPPSFLAHAALLGAIAAVFISSALA